MNVGPLIEAWERWDRACEAQARGERNNLSLATASNRLEDQVQSMATEMGIDGSELRRRVVARRVDGESASKAIGTVCF